MGFATEFRSEPGSALAEPLISLKLLLYVGIFIEVVLVVVRWVVLIVLGLRKREK